MNNRDWHECCLPFITTLIRDLTTFEFNNIVHGCPNTFITVLYYQIHVCIICMLKLYCLFNIFRDSILSYCVHLFIYFLCFSSHNAFLKAIKMSSTDSHLTLHRSYFNATDGCVRLTNQTSCNKTESSRDVICYCTEPHFVQT